MPVLHEEGRPELTQSHVISRYLAKKFDLTGDNDWEDARVDEAISLIFDLFMCKYHILKLCKKVDYQSLTRNIFSRHSLANLRYIRAGSGTEESDPFQG